MAGKYSFNRLHAAAYALTAYCGAWLKASYPTAFYTVALQWADDKEIPLLMSEMEQCSSTKIVPPDINISAYEFYPDFSDNRIFWSLTRIKMVGTKTIDYIVQKRAKNGPFTGIYNFIHRIFKYKLKKYQYWDDPDSTEESGRVPVNARHVKHLILAGCFDRLEQIDTVNQRYDILVKAAAELGFAVDGEELAPDKPDYFWSQQQISVSGIGSIDYRKIFDHSEAKEKVKGKATYSTLQNALKLENEGKKVAVCATVVEVDEMSYKDKTTGEKKVFCKLKLKQNNELMELVCWNDFYLAHRDKLPKFKGKLIVTTAVIRYSDYNACNSLNTFKKSLLFIVE